MTRRSIYRRCSDLASELGLDFHQETEARTGEARIVYVLDTGGHERRLAPGHCLDVLEELASRTRQSEGLETCSTCNGSGYELDFEIDISARNAMKHFPVRCPDCPGIRNDDRSEAEILSDLRAAAV